MLLDYLDLHSVLAGRLVCQQWRSSFRGSTAVTKLQLQQPTAISEAASLGHAVARAASLDFNKVTTVCLKLADAEITPIDLTTLPDDDDDEN